MAPGTEYTQNYQRAINAYMNGTYEEAAQLTEQLVNSHPADPNLRLLRGHIYCCLQSYDEAHRQYQLVLDLSTDPELLECARMSLADVERFRSEPQTVLSPEPTPVATEPPINEFGPETLEFLGLTSPPGSEGGSVPSPEFPSQAQGPELTYLENPHAPQTQSPGEQPTDLFDQSLLEELATALNPEFSSNLESSSLAAEPFSGLKDPQEVISREESDRPWLPTAGVESELMPESRLDPETFAGEIERPVSSSDSVEELPAEEVTMPLLSGSGQSPRLLPASPELDFLDDLGDPRDYEVPVPGRAEDWSSEAALYSMGGDTAPAPEPVGAIEELEEPGGSTARFIPVDLTAQSSRATQDLGPRPLSLWIAAGVAGILSALLVAAVLQLTPRLGTAAGEPRVRLPETGLAALIAGLASGGTALVVGQRTTRRFQRTNAVLQERMEAVAQGRWATQALPVSQADLGPLAHSFNQMMVALHRVTGEAQQRAMEQEAAREALQQQVIHLLDEVEGAAQGDLTVQAEVTADVLGAVADSFNLTINSLRKLVQQVKVAAQQVSTGATENETFARSLSADALRQAEEFAATLNSVQFLTQSIQRVAASSREADAVARSASVTARKGGESVERTVAGILKIRETVAESTRKVKHLAESSQEISKIVALITQIASRTNRLALNASIEAVRAGEAGRGFAVVADEVRQLADRAAKASKEIEHIVLQIQSETSSVMTAMEEGTQQVIEGTRLAEQAKRSLDDIIQVSAHIDTLVGSITAATVEQTETSQAMAQVMQAVELTAQETSQESQRVSASLRTLVRVARDLQESVEQFKVE
jgi:twitching motility protein PilJ